MTSQRKFNLIWLLLPLLVLRGLVPAGFMIDTSSDGLSMVICSGGVYKTVAVDQPGVPGAGDHLPGQQSDSICPFAAVAAGAPPSNDVPMLFGVSVDGFVVSDVAQFCSSFGPSRTQQSRAPPFFS